MIFDGAQKVATVERWNWLAVHINDSVQVLLGDPLFMSGNVLEAG